MKFMMIVKANHHVKQARGRNPGLTAGLFR